MARKQGSPYCEGDTEEEEVIGVKVVHNAPDPRLANKNLGKCLELADPHANSCCAH